MSKLNKQCHLFKCKALVFNFSTYCLSLFKRVQSVKASEYPMQRMMLSAVQATDE